MKILILSILCLAICPQFPAELIKNETSTSTQSQGFFGYFGNMWKKQFPPTTSTPILKPLRTRTPIETSTLPPAGIIGHVKNWMNAIKDRMPLKMQPTTPSINYTKISGAKIARKNHPVRRITNRTTVSLNISNSSAKNIKRADTEISGASESFAELPNAGNAVPSETKYVNSYDEFVKIEDQETTSVEEATVGRVDSSLTTSLIDVNNNTTVFSSSSFTKDMDITESNKSTSTIEPIPNFFGDLEKNNSYTDTPILNPKGFESIDLNSRAMKPITMKKRSGDYKLTPSNLLFYKADDLTGNTSKSESELILTTSNYTRIRTKKSTAVKKSRSRKTTNGMTSTRQQTRFKLNEVWKTPIVLTSGWLI